VRVTRRAVSQEHEVLALIDRGDLATMDRTAYNPQEFYAFADPQGVVHIRWMKDLPDDWTIVGALLYTLMPFVKKPGAGSGFAEFSDDFDF
jgi:hypothetical protein